MMRRVAVLCCILAMGLPLQGCWNYREVDSLMIVAGMAVDAGQEGHKYHLTIDLADTSNAGKDKPVVSALVESEGDSIFEAIRNSITRVGMELYWQNCQVVIISQDVAGESIAPIIDWLNRDPEPRLTIEMYVSQAPTAKEVLVQKSAAMAITSFEIDKYYEINEKIRPVAEYKMLYNVYNDLASRGKSLLLPALNVAGNADSPACVLSGIAYFDKDRLAGFLPAEESQFAMFVLNHVRGGVITVRSPEENTIAALEIHQNKTAVTVQARDGKLFVTIETGTETAIDELDTKTNYLKKDRREELKSMAEIGLAADIAGVVRAMQERGYDIFGFSDVLHRSDPDSWNALRENWRDVFRQAEVRVSCGITIRNGKESRFSVGGGS